MEDRVKLRVMGISYSSIRSGSYAVILAQVDGPYRIPVVIGGAEAQSIAIKMENIKPPRPLTHDLFVTFAHAFGVTLREVYINSFEDGIFSSELTFSDGDRQIVIDSRTSDAIAIAIRTHAPIYTSRDILDRTGFLMEEDDRQDDDEETVSADDEDEYTREPKVENYSIEELERTLNKLISEEQYEEAARISKILNAKRGGQTNQ
ncbi:MAG: bifunctional nuclease family protein [Pseudoflavonifractor sp.]|nr:bifunctional nuclease family protein [Pseudoflavonifractor sp.]